MCGADAVRARAHCVGPVGGGVGNRQANPTMCSELHIAENWYRSTALEDLLGLPAESIYDDRLYRALGRPLPRKQPRAITAATTGPTASRSASPGSDARGDAVGLRSVRRKPPRRDHGGRDRHDHGHSSYRRKLACRARHLRLALHAVFTHRTKKLSLLPCVGRPNKFFRGPNCRSWVRLCAAGLPTGYSLD